MKRRLSGFKGKVWIFKVEKTSNHIFVHSFVCLFQCLKNVCSTMFFSIFVSFRSRRILCQTQAFVLLVCSCKKASECFRHNQPH